MSLPIYSKNQGKSVFRLRNFNMVGALPFI
jgi:hypothetical protein